MSPAQIPSAKQMIRNCSFKGSGFGTSDLGLGWGRRRS
jgi:hypothetical protein